MKTHVLFLSLLCLVLSAGCGYRLARPSNPVLEDVHTIAIPYFKNNSFEPGLEAIFTNAFVNEFVASRRLQVVGVEQAEVVLYGKIKEVSQDSIAYNLDDKAREYRIRVNLSVSLEERRTGTVLWKRNSMKHTEEFPVSQHTVFSEAAKREALKTLAEDLAERVHDSIMQGF